MLGWFLTNREGMSPEEYEAENNQTVMNTIASHDDRRRKEIETGNLADLSIKDAEAVNRDIERKRWFPRWN